MRCIAMIGHSHILRVKPLIVWQNNFHTDVLPTQKLLEVCMRLHKSLQSPSDRHTSPDRHQNVGQTSPRQDREYLIRLAPECWTDFIPSKQGGKGIKNRALLYTKLFCQIWFRIETHHRSKPSGTHRHHTHQVSWSMRLYPSPDLHILESTKTRHTLYCTTVAHTPKVTPCSTIPYISLQVTTTALLTPAVAVCSKHSSRHWYLHIDTVQDKHTAPRRTEQHFWNAPPSRED